MKDEGKVRYTTITDAEALEAFKLLTSLEGIIPALESAHAIAALTSEASKRNKKEIVVVNLSGRGDKDLATVMNALSL